MDTAIFSAWCRVKHFFIFVLYIISYTYFPNYKKNKDKISFIEKEIIVL